MFITERRIESVGLQSTVEIGDYLGDPAVRKLCGQDLSLQDLASLTWAIPDYKDQLQLYNINLPNSFELSYTERGIEMIDQLVPGKDVDVLIRSRSAELPFIWRDMVRTLCSLNTGASKSAVAIDGKPANFIRHTETNELFYIDLFPPMLRDVEGLIIPWIQSLYKRDRQMMSFNFGDTRGQFVKLLSGSKIAYPELYKELSEWTLREMDGRVPTTVMDYVVDQEREQFPDMAVFYRGGALDGLIARLYA